MNWEDHYKEVFGAPIESRLFIQNCTDLVAKFDPFMPSTVNGEPVIVAFFKWGDLFEWTDVATKYDPHIDNMKAKITLKSFVERIINDGDDLEDWKDGFQEACSELEHSRINELNRKEKK